MIELVFAALILVCGLLGMTPKSGVTNKTAGYLLGLFFFVATLPKSPPLAVVMTIFYLVFYSMHERARSRVRVKGAIVKKKFVFMKYFATALGLISTILLFFTLKESRAVENVYNYAQNDEVNIAVFLFLLVLYFGGKKKCES